jgi:hypothetical protein
VSAEPAAEIPKDGVQLYKALIDQFVETASHEVLASRIRKWGHSERTNNDHLPWDAKEAERVQCFSQMSLEQREVIAGLLEQARQSAVHDVCASLEWLTTAGGLEIRWHGVVLPESPFGSYHYDFVCRLDGDTWPDEVNDKGPDDTNS